MNILHYALGFPPYRSGGLTKFCFDLAKQQVREGDTVGMLWPGEMRISGHQTSIRYHQNDCGVHSYEVINPNPISYDEGIMNIDSFMEKGDEEIYMRFLKQIKPDVIHFHTFMGMHKSLLTAAKKMGIRTCFTAHDFYPICAKVTLFRDGEVCTDAEKCSSCPVCNVTALSTKKIWLLQSSLYRKIKDVPVVKKLRKEHRDAYLSDEQEPNKKKNSLKPEDYLKLRNFYEQMLRNIDIVHFNSSVTKSVFDTFFQIPNNVIIPITHADISEHQMEKKAHDRLHISYFGPQSVNKGYFILKKALDELWNQRKDFSLNVYFEPVKKGEYEIPHQRYSYDELTKVMQKADIVIVPSIGYETFGYTVLEAMSYGVPVIVSNRVGAKDIIPIGGGIVFDEINPLGIWEVLEGLNMEKVKEMNAVLCRSTVLTIEQMSRMIKENCY